jgi:hypothetical protein
MSKLTADGISNKKTGLYTGIAALPAARNMQKSQADAKRLFDLTMEERGSTEELRALVTQESIRELIFRCVSLTKTMRARVNAQRSNAGSVRAREKALSTVHDWLDRNIRRYNGNLAKCAIDCHAELNNKPGGLGRSEAWIRKEITAYRKNTATP